jgi:hypothetical protein
LLEYFCKLFPDRLDSKVRALEGTAWRAVSKFHLLTDSEIEESISRRSRLLRAVSATDRTSFLVFTFDLDPYEKRIEIFDRLREALLKIGISNHSLFRSSDKEKWQLFVFFSSPADSEEVLSLISQWLAKEKLDELITIFPSTGLPIPLQANFAWLDNKGTVSVSREQLSNYQALELFLQDFVDKGIDWLEVASRLRTNFEGSTLNHSSEPILVLQSVTIEAQNENCNDEFGPFFEQNKLAGQGIEPHISIVQTGEPHADTSIESDYCAADEQLQPLTMQHMQSENLDQTSTSQDALYIDSALTADDSQHKEAPQQLHLFKTLGDRAPPA